MKLSRFALPWHSLAISLAAVLLLVAQRPSAQAESPKSLLVAEQP